MSDSSSPSTSKDFRVRPDFHYLVIDRVDQTMAILDGDFDEDRSDRYIVVQKIPDHVLEDWFSERVSSSQIDEERDDVTHCDSCKAFYRRFCFMHPVYFCPDRRIPEHNPEGLTKAELSIPPFLEIKESRIPNAGKGVFALMDVPVGTCFGPYKGEKVFEPNSKGYIWEIRRKGKPLFFRDGQDPKRSNWMRFINSALHEDEQNLIAFQYEWKVFYRVFKPIAAGAELLVWYGDDFGEELGAKRVFSTEHSTKQAPKTPKKKNPFVL
ncbi:hypothetical protein QR680_012376 [Steinernema hermaphroditum]|uniref:SET domain-containing protein n=1 Tax=Steinernema hermaphroditum TaxID=289476 RepID=A0AA39I3S7_9BILA|nr:hypothetical protein QR680_012376 [Steinernema hermaphroditum]